MNIPRIELCQLRQVAPNKIPLPVELLRLRHRIENPEPRLRIAPGRRRPLPAADIRGQVVIVQLARKITFAPAPVDAQVLHQKAGRDHAQPVVHEAGRVQLRHGRVDQRIAGAAFAPGRKQVLRAIARFPHHGVKGRLERLLRDVRVVEQDHRVEVAPDQFRQPDRGARAAGAVGHHLAQRAHQVAHRGGAEAQVDRQARGRVQRREIARRAVVGQARQEGFEQDAGARHAGRGGQGTVVEAECGQAGQRRGRNRRQACRIRFHHPWRRRFRLRVQALEPGIFIRGEHAIHTAAQRQHLAFFEDDLVLEAQQGAAVRLQGLLDLRVAGDRLGFVVLVEVDGSDIEFGRQAWDQVARGAVTHQQAAAELAQFRIQFAQAGVDEAHPAVIARQAGQDLGVEHEDAINAAVLPGVAQCMVQGGMVEDAQVASEPDQRLAFRNHRVFSQQGGPFYGLGLNRCAWLTARTTALQVAGRAFQCKLSKSLMLLSGY
jgi:hypothetical protein